MKDLKDPDKVQLPSCDLILIALRVEESRHRSSFTLLDDLLLDHGHGSEVETSVSETFCSHAVDLTHVVNSSVASSTD